MTSDSPASWPQLGSDHKDGSRFVGRELGPVDPFWFAGTPIVNKMVQATVNLDAVSSVRVGDPLTLLFDGVKNWWLWRENSRLGRLSWSPGTFEPRAWKDYSAVRIDDGVLEVTRLLLDGSGQVINCGGIVRRA